MHATDIRGTDQRRLSDTGSCTASETRGPKFVAASALTLTVLVPAYNEGQALHGTLSGLLNQTVPIDRILVINDGSTDDTAEVAALYNVEVLTRVVATGSKAKAQNYALPYCDTDLVCTIDGDTVCAPTFIEEMKKAFADPKVAIAAGNVQVLDPKGFIQRGRQIEYLFGLHMSRPVQNMAGAPQVCSGCASMFRLAELKEIGGFPPGTVAEDMDYSWRMMLAGYSAVYVPNAEVKVIDPKNPAQLKNQLWRWMSGYFQNLRTHWKEIIRRKKMLVVWAILAVLDALVVPLWYATPIVLLAETSGHALKVFLALWLAMDIGITVPVVMYAAVKRGYNPLRVLANIPFIYIVRVFNSYYVLKAMIVELILVPLGWAHSLDVFIKGHD